MAGLIGACIVLAILCMILIIQKIYLAYRIRKLAEQVDGFNSGTSEILDVALQEDRLVYAGDGVIYTDPQRKGFSLTGRCYRLGTKEVTTELNESFLWVSC